MKNPANVSEQFVEAVPGGKVIVELFTRRRGRNVRRTRMTVWRGDVAHQRTVHTIWPEHERQRFAAEFFAEVAA